jgi:hypothetical protein
MAVVAILAVAGFAAASRLVSSDGVRVAPTCSETCAPAQTTAAPPEHSPLHGRVSDRSLDRRAAGKERSAP